MGELMRRYWVPALLSREIPAPDSPPVRVKLLGERLLGFRDSRGRVGLIEEFCAHRGTSLFFGRNEECGIRCAYHGWKYDVDGNCVELPQQPSYAKEIKLTAYPCLEQGGVIWTYMGPARERPEPPALEWSTLPESHCYVSRRWQECNYLQALEGAIDSSHVSFVHRFEVDIDPMHVEAAANKYLKADPNPMFEVHDSAGGLTIVTRRNGEPDSYYWRITQFIMPWYTFIPPFGEHALGAHAFVPMDDENCWTWNINYYVDRPLDEVQLKAMKDGRGIHGQVTAGTLRAVANRDNDYLIDRAAQRERRAFSGIFGFAIQDSSLQESMGPIQDRTKEHLVPTDRAIVVARNRLAEAAHALRDGAGEPPGVRAAGQRLRAGCVLLGRDRSIEAWYREALIARAGNPIYTV
ncbi:MAG TPA: Rieske 2Fe-2S domain-containing protein [Candidatus Binataceae bacterium]|nr:Rieske 2Fe-2S domain-containing protein [Candidatus Binataceae bacterium]